MLRKIYYYSDGTFQGALKGLEVVWFDRSLLDHSLPWIPYFLAVLLLLHLINCFRGT
jgi:hypothetical protein